MGYSRGFRKEPKHYRLTFEDPTYEGFEAICKSLSLEDMLSITQMASDIQGGDMSKVEVSRQYELFADALLSWNLEDEVGNPVPTTYEALKAQDVDFVSDLLQAWMQAVMSVSRPLKSDSNSGETSAALMAAMDDSSQSL